MMQREALITAAATATVQRLFEIVKEDAIDMRVSGTSAAEVASYAATIAAEMAFRAVGLAMILAKEESREALVDEAMELITKTLRSRREELLVRSTSATRREQGA